MDETALYRLFTRLEFKNYITRLGLHAPEEDAVPKREIVHKELHSGEQLFAAIADKQELILTAPHSLEAVCVLSEDTAYLLCADQVGTQGWHAVLAAAVFRKGIR